MATRLTLICHARTQAQKLARFPLDEPIDMDWQAAGQSLAASFKSSVQLLSAPETRAQQTAQLFGSQSEVIPALRDCAFGRWAGQRINDLQTQEPDALFAWLADSDAAPHGGESVTQLCTRVGAWLDSLRDPGHFVAITHPFVIRAALLHALQCPPSAFNSIDIEPLSMTDLRFNGRWRLRMEQHFL
ncbi:histidine phosphatase family protein [Pseudomonas sp. NA-150]|uniref:histidine phosphatase family protein n=1 Tax=Pseudomonas sp. NA-150 TaxID=3367525 RepID=UPI0037C58836